MKHMFRRTGLITAAVLIAAAAGIGIFIRENRKSSLKEADATGNANAPLKEWIVPDTSELRNIKNGDLIRYGKDLIVNTSYYFGPKGILGYKSNGLNCQNCHLDAGTKSYGNNFALVASGYPKFKERSASMETVVKKVEDCFDRSLNGKSIDSNSREMKAFIAYLQWIGKNVKKGAPPVGTGIEELPLLARAADTAKGRMVYLAKCQTCHGVNGSGLLNAQATGYTYPPLWGEHSYNIGASIYRISKFAGFVKNNMPFGSTHAKQQVSDEEAWDVAAFVNSQPHPFKDLSKDWPKLATKPFDYPFGPYADTLFSVRQRKYGPFRPIRDYYTSVAKNK